MRNPTLMCSSAFFLFLFVQLSTASAYHGAPLLLLQLKVDIPTANRTLSSLPSVWETGQPLHGNRSALIDVEKVLALSPDPLEDVKSLAVNDFVVARVRGRIAETVDVKGDSVAGILIGVSVIILVLICMLVISDASSRPFEVTAGGSRLLTRHGRLHHREAAYGGPKLDRPVPPPRSGLPSSQQLLPSSLIVPPPRASYTSWTANNVWVPGTNANGTPATTGLLPTQDLPHPAAQEELIIPQPPQSQRPLGSAQVITSPAIQPSLSTGMPTPASVYTTPHVPTTNPGEAGLARPSYAQSPKAPPPLCPALVLPHCEAWFAVSVEKLMEGVGSFDVLGLSGNPLLRATVRHTGQGRCIEVSMTPASSPTLASIGAPSMAAMGGAPPALEVHAAGGCPYGELRPSRGGGYSLTCKGEEVVLLASDPQTGRLLLYAPGERVPLACAARCTESAFCGEQYLEVRVNPGVDAVLVLCCVLAVALFGGGAALPS